MSINIYACTITQRVLFCFKLNFSIKIGNIVFPDTVNAYIPLTRIVAIEVMMMTNYCIYQGLTPI